MPRVLSIATLYPNSVAPRFGTFVARQMEALAAMDAWDVTVVNPIGIPLFAIGKYADLADAAMDGHEHGVDVRRPRFTLIPKLGGRFNPNAIARAVLPLARRLHAENSFDLVDAQFFYPDGPAASRIATALGLPLSIKARGADISHWGSVNYAQRMMIEAGERADGLLSVSEALKADMAAIGLPRDKITVHYTGLDHTIFKPHDRGQARASLNRDYAISTEGPLIATVGALIPRKGQQFVLEAMAARPRAQLAFVGTGPDRRALQDRTKELGLADRVHFLGSLDHSALPIVLSAANAMALPSASEGLANAWVEALACGTPLVITDAGGARELVRKPSAGRIVERNAKAIAVAITEVLAARYTPAEVATNVADFSWAANAAGLARYYESLLA